MVIKKIVQKGLDDIKTVSQIPGKVKAFLDTPMTRREFIGRGIKKINPNASVDIGGIPTADEALQDVQGLAKSALNSWSRGLPGRIVKKARNKALNLPSTPMSVLDELADLENTGNQLTTRRAFLEKLGNKARNYNSSKLDPIDKLKKRPARGTALEEYEAAIEKRKKMSLKDYLAYMEELKNINGKFSFMDYPTANFKIHAQSHLKFNPDIGTDVHLPQPATSLYSDKLPNVNKLATGPDFPDMCNTKTISYSTKRQKDVQKGLLRYSNAVNRQLGAI